MDTRNGMIYEAAHAVAAAFRRDRWLAGLK